MSRFYTQQFLTVHRNNSNPKWLFPTQTVCFVLLLPNIQPALGHQPRTAHSRPQWRKVHCQDNTFVLVVVKLCVLDSGWFSGCDENIYLSFYHQTKCEKVKLIPSICWLPVKTRFVQISFNQTTFLVINLSDILLDVISCPWKSVCGACSWLVM